MSRLLVAGGGPYRGCWLLMEVHVEVAGGGPCRDGSGILLCVVVEFEYEMKVK